MTRLQDTRVPPGVDLLHTLRDVDDLRVKSTEAVVQRPGYKVGGLLGLYQQRMGDGLYVKARAMEATKYALRRVEVQEEGGDERRSPRLAEAHVTAA